MKLTKTAIRQALKSCEFDPRKDVLECPIIEMIMDDPDYAIQRSIEILRDIKYIKNSLFDKDAEDKQVVKWVKQTIKLLIQRVAIYESNECEAKGRARSEDTGKHNPGATLPGMVCKANAR